ncbi:hypothetical protein CROQUDRAFT_130411 [Cronartium quercuum f. sp. fusiforme G11]|uniref:DH domain-containing protein n=1 Tax=Cronartium quercuum f. sp. fusiforme G11 TaxID=708437 RepID=A0A9P6THP8_9BASI|nr:hypothetical protein CROQUDRAFT_130411 [Cronartium quercuum f. sp. fusiforme G11]
MTGSNRSTRVRLRLFPSSNPKFISEPILPYTIPEATQSAPDLTSPTLDSHPNNDRRPWDWLNSNSTLPLPLPPPPPPSPPPLPPLCPISPLTLHLHSTPSNSTIQSSSTSTPSKLTPQSPRSTRLERRFQALLELCDTEAGYLRDLRILVHGYLAILDRAPFVSSDDKIVVRRNVDQVLELAERFSRRISLAVGSKLELWRTPGSARDEFEVDKLIERLAKAFISESPIFIVYEDFCARHTEAADIIRDLEASPEWIALLQQSRSAETSPAPSGQPSSSTSLAPSIPQITFQTSLASLGMIPSVPSHSRLRLQDFAIKPIQRIMRYPLLLASLLKYMDGDSNPAEVRARDKVYQALGAMKEVASGVDDAKSSREVELKTELIASRMELHSSYRAAFVSLLGQIQLVGSLHVLYHGPVLDPSEAFKIKYHGIFLYQTHLVIVKVKRTTVYEPRHWFPIRYFELVDIPECSGRLKYRHHTFDFGATWEPEKKLWMDKLKVVKDEVENMRAIHLQSDLPLNDDSIVSSINLDESSSSTASTPPASAPPDPKLPSAASGPYSPDLTEDALMLNEKEDSPEDSPAVTPHSAAHSLSSAHLQQSRVSQRLSRNVNTLLGRTPEVAQAAIDLKLTEVFSDLLLAARMQGQREQELSDLTSRQRTLSGPGTNKRHSQYLPTAPGTAHSFSRAADRKMKRMSYMGPSTRTFIDPFAFKPFVEPAAELPPLPHETVLASPVSVKSSSSSLRRAKTGPPTERPTSIHDLWRLNRASTTTPTSRSRPPSTVLQPSPTRLLIEPLREKTTTTTRTSRSGSCEDGGSSSGMSAVEARVEEPVRNAGFLFSSPEPSSGHSSATTMQESVEDRGGSGRMRLKSECSLRARAHAHGYGHGTGSGSASATSRPAPVVDALKEKPEEQPPPQTLSPASLTLTSALDGNVDLTLSPTSAGLAEGAIAPASTSRFTATRKISRSATYSLPKGPPWSKLMSRKNSRFNDVSDEPSTKPTLDLSITGVEGRSGLSGILSNPSSTSPTTTSTNKRPNSIGWSLPMPGFLRSKSSGHAQHRSSIASLFSNHNNNNNHNTTTTTTTTTTTNNSPPRSRASAFGINRPHTPEIVTEPEVESANHRMRNASNGSRMGGLRSFLRMTPLTNSEIGHHHHQSKVVGTGESPESVDPSRFVKSYL